LLGQTIVEFDNNIGQAFVDLVPGASIKELSDAQLEAIVNDPKNLDAVSRCMRGTTALIAIVDPDSANLWVASLGDCTASEYLLVLDVTRLLFIA
jgi:pyruvate dehydrogenase phosphatase